MGIEKRIDDLESEVRSIKEDLSVKTTITSQYQDIFGREVSYKKTVSLKDALLAILDHLGMQVDLPDPQPKAVLSAKTEENEKESE